MNCPECRAHGHDYGSTDDDNVEVCSRCGTQRYDDGTARRYILPAHPDH